MKKWFAAIIAMFIVCIASGAMATTQAEWGKSCLRKIPGTVTVYDIVWKESTATDLTEGEQFEFHPIGTASNTYVTSLDAAFGGKSNVFYLDGSGQVQEGWVDSGSIVYCAVAMDVGMGRKIGIPELIARNAEEIADYVSITYGYDAELDDIRKAISELGSSSSSSSGKKKTSAAAKSLGTVQVYWTDEEGEDQPVKLKTLGTVYATIEINKETLTVPTKELKWESEADAAHALAIINAPKSGEAALRAKASSSGKVLLKGKTNRVVLVIKAGKNYTRILYDDTVGLVKTSSLRFCPVGYGAERPQTGWITFRGKTVSKNTIKIRAKASGSSRSLGEFKAGTPITIFGTEGKWTEIEAEGYHGFILSEFVTVDEDAAQEPADEADTDDATPEDEEDPEAVDDEYDSDEDEAIYDDYDSIEAEE